MYHSFTAALRRMLNFNVPPTKASMSEPQWKVSQSYYIPDVQVYLHANRIGSPTYQMGGNFKEFGQQFVENGELLLPKCSTLISVLLY